MAVVKGRGACLRRDERGAVYVEFLLSFPPLFLLFMAICQLSLVATAELVVQHSATRAARSAIVVLEEDPQRYGGALRGQLSQGGAQQEQDFSDLLMGFGLLDSLPPDRRNFIQRTIDSFKTAAMPQQGARMRPIRNAAYLGLISLAPSSFDATSDRSLASALRSDFAEQLIQSLAYTRAASVVTIQQGPGSAALVAEPVGRDAPVTVRVTYFYRCSVPIVRSLVCRSLQRLLDGGDQQSNDRAAQKWEGLKYRYQLAETPGRLDDLAKNAFFRVLEAEATLPNQGAAYYTVDPEDEEG
jgi:hypothetical protein